MSWLQHLENKMEVFQEHSALSLKVLLAGRWSKHYLTSPCKTPLHLEAELDHNHSP